MTRDSIRALVDAANRHVDDLCTGKARWRMSVPVDIDRDSDTIIAGALAQTELLLAVADAAAALVEQEGDCDPMGLGCRHISCPWPDLTRALAALEATR